MKRLFGLIPALVYGLVGVVALVFGALVFCRTGFVKDQEHLILEFAAGAIAVGLVSCLVSFRFRQSWPWRIAVLAFLVLMAIIHIGDWLVGNVPLTSPLMNSAPIAFVLAAELAAWHGGRGFERPSPANRSSG